MKLTNLKENYPQIYRKRLKLESKKKLSPHSTEAGGISQRLRTLFCLQNTQVWFAASTSGGSQPPVTLVPEAPMPCGFQDTYVHTQGLL